jgi:hypothetical protein
MAFTISSIAAKDGTPATIGGGLLAADTVGGGAGPFFLFHGLVDGLAGANRAQITAGNALKVDGSAVTQPVSLAAETTKVIGVTRTADGAGNLITSTGNAIDVNIKTGGGSGGTALADAAAFTEGTTSITPIGGVFKTSQTPLTTGQAGAVALTAAREMLTEGKIWDGINVAAVKPASTAPVATDPAVVVAISPNGQNGNGLASAGNSAPTVQASVTAAVSVVAAVTAGAYTAGFIIGGILTFAGILDNIRFSGVLQSIAVKFKGTAVTGNIQVALFKASPSNGTYADHTAGTWNAADMANLLGVYQLTSPLSSLGAMTAYNLDGIGKAIQGASQSLFAIVTVSGTPTPASTSDMTVELGVLPG